ncbi:heme ABC transporter ATP-binding protein [Fulvimarina sp. 2208YS6-2-32]|uniref:Heme ABC transporter ATP-binding protein n=1 Tax=Fulvimarina uroteuthidis TaxID=3098149 RepID=A0ABU5I471_9HYPH|nr:heme ABC transporter ATP-binding protein [Fulvimarina sp. 2208YS6-2-32]MDY8110180.1 heme ABC transporter ATP-binding protein [Fulvimarina sp. 2208YS6-2-32]
MLEIQDATVRYGTRTILASANVAIAPGSVTVVVGPNGAGKSTLLKLMTGEIAPSGGRVRLDGRALADMPARMLAQRRAVLPQSSALSFPFTVAEVIRLGLEAGGHRLAPRAIGEALRRVELAGFEARGFDDLSGGEQQRVHMARVLCQIGDPSRWTEPRYLFLDEPVSSLDIRHQLTVLRLAHALAREGAGVVAVLHDLNLAAAFADRLLVVLDGTIAAIGEPAAVISDALLERVFDLPLRVGELPSPGVPFVLPQTAAFASLKEPRS